MTPHPPRASESPLHRIGLTAVLALLVVVLASPTGAVLPALAPSAVPSQISGGRAAPLGPTGGALPPTDSGAPGVVPATGGNPWTDLSANLSVHPSAREGAVSIFDPNSGSVLLFGGLARNRSLADTWEFKAGHWTNMTPSLAISPPPRYKGGIVYDAADGFVLLFGGNANSLYRNDTWAWNGSAWHRVITPVAPSPREDFNLVYDVFDQYVLLFAGEQFDLSYVSDTWTFSAGVWTNISASVGTTPPPREAGGAAYDRADGYVLLFSGKRTETSLLDDTWTYRSGVWTNRTGSLSVAPPARESMSLADDIVDDFVLLFGGFNFPDSLADEWMWSAGNWTQLFPTSAPSQRMDAPLAYFPNGALGFVLLFGGRSDPLANATLYNDTWSYKVPINVFLTSPSTIDLGETVSMTLHATGGYAPLTLSWAGLPPGCSGGNVATISCQPTTAGTYAIVGSALDTGGFNVSSFPFVFQVNPDPALTASGSPLSGPAVLNVSFNSTVTGGTAPFVYAWQFGDGNVSNASAPNHIYFPGVFTALLNVTDARGFPATTTVGPINVSAPSIALAVTMTANPTSGVAPLTVDFTSSPTGGVAPYRIAWTFGVTGARTTTQNASYTYASPGTFTVLLVVTDLIGEQVSASTLITVDAPIALTAAAAATPAAGIVPLPVGFFGSATGGVTPYTFAWSFGPTGASSANQNPSYTYSVAGTYNATLTVTDGAGTTAVAWVEVVAAPALAATFVASPASPYCSSGSGFTVVTVVADASGGSGGYTYAWTFPSGVASPGSIPQTSLIVSAGPTYVISLRVTDSSGTAVGTHQNVTTPSVSCTSTSAGSLGPIDWLLWILILVVVAVIGVELILLLRRREK